MDEEPLESFNISLPVPITVPCPIANRETYVPCLENIALIERRCLQLGLALNKNYIPWPSDVASSIGDSVRDEDDRSASGSSKQGDSVLEMECYSREYEVDKIHDYKYENGIEWYLIQWRGWSPKVNSWEPADHLSNCKAKLNEFHRLRNKGFLPIINGKLDRKRQLEDDHNLLQKSKRVCEAKASKTQMKLKQQQLHLSKPKTNTKAKYSAEKMELIAKLKAWQAEINQVTGEEAPILVVNDVDMEGPPSNFVYINDYKPCEEIVIPDDPLVGCECAPNSSCHSSKDKCCGHLSGGEFAYNCYRRLRINHGMPIYECNKRCKCGDSCINRVVQHGRKIKLVIFRTSNDCGWGVRTLQAIKKDTFVMEYVGEVITNEEAEKRGKIYDAEGRTYLFDLDYDDNDCTFTVDAARFGNVSHFMNHSCEPNLVVSPVWINTLDPRLPRIAFFTNRDVARGEELTFDYKMSGATPLPAAKETAVITVQTNTEADEPMTGVSTPPPVVVDNLILQPIPCKCKSQSCRKYLF